MSVAGKPAVGRVAALLLLPLVLLAGCTTPRAYLGEEHQRQQ
jgi:hypothetical protein